MRRFLLLAAALLCLVSGAQAQTTAQGLVVFGGVAKGISDNFLRANTAAPGLGTPTSIQSLRPAHPWTLFSSGFNAPVDGSISSNTYVAGNGAVVYAVQNNLHGSIRSIRGLVSFADAAQGTQTAFGTPTFIIAAAPYTLGGSIKNALHIVPARTGISYQTLVNGSFVNFTAGSWSYGSTTYIPKDGATLVPFLFDFDESGNWTSVYAGRFASGTEAAIPGLAGFGSSSVCAEVFNSPGTNLDSRAQFQGVAFGRSGALANVLPLIAQNNFDVSTGLTLGTGWSLSGGVAVHGGNAGNLTPTSGPAAAVGKRYLITYTLTPAGFVGNLTFSFGGASGTTRTAQGTYSDIVTAVNTSSWVIAAGSGAVTQFVNEFSIVQLDTF